MLTGNKGEWSEAYVLLKLLGDGKIYAANENLEPNEQLSFPLVKVFRDEPDGNHIEFLLEKSGTVVIELNESKHTTLPCSVFSEEASYLLDQMTASHDTSSFPIERTEFFLASLGCRRIKASSADKTDIAIQIHDPQTGFEPICGFSIKSEIGSASTLLNATQATNFVYKVNGLSAADVKSVNAIDGPRKIIDRMAHVFSESRSVAFQRVANNTFASNLMLVDSRMHEILAEALLVHYRDGIKKVSDVVYILEEDNPLDFPVRGFYRHKMKKFLCAVALGFQPARQWDGKDEANGGYIIVTSLGDIVAFHIYNRDSFEEYLLDSTNFERGSTARHEFASLYKEGDSVLMNLNLQIRF